MNVATRTNLQRPLAADYAKDTSIDVHSVFQTIQGEGPFCGERALFIRLYGCNLRCPGCDTEYTAVKMPFASDDLVRHVAIHHDWPVGALIVLTGGEPFRQNVVPAIYALLTAGYKVQVETNGVLCPPNFDMLDKFTRFSVVCSPKTSRIHETIAAKAIAYKYVLRASEIAEDGLPTLALGHAATPYIARPTRANVPIYVQPMDEQDDTLNVANTKAAVASCMTFGYLLQIQIHKILGVD